MNNYVSRNHSKYYLKVHLIFVCKYRKKLLINNFDNIVKNIILEISYRSNFIIDILETDEDHIHMLISYPPKLSVTSIIRKLKQESTIYLWKNYPKFLSKHFWKEHTFWSDGYFACSIGEANPETIKRYIENQD